MKLSLLATTFALATPIFAAPTWGDWSHCLSQGEAEEIVGKYISILAHTDVQAANATAQALLADDYQEISDSILSLEGQPLGGVTFQGKEVYVANVLFAPPVQDIDTIEILVAGCTKILWYWNFLGIGTKQYEVKGFNLFTINEKKQIQTVNLEFNSFAWALDTGYTITFPPNPSPTKRA